MTTQYSTRSEYSRPVGWMLVLLALAWGVANILSASTVSIGTGVTAVAYFIGFTVIYGTLMKLGLDRLAATGGLLPKWGENNGR